MRLGFTGTQVGMSSGQQGTFLYSLRYFNPSVFIHGDCIGADADAHAMTEPWAEVCGTKIIVRPSDLDAKRAFNRNYVFKTYAPEPPLVRNRKIVHDSDILIACPRKFREETRSGTWATIRYACGMKPILIIWRDGLVNTILSDTDLDALRESDERSVK